MFDNTKYKDFLSGLELPCLTESDSKHLVEPITLEELKDTIL